MHQFGDSPVIGFGSFCVRRYVKRFSSTPTSRRHRRTVGVTSLINNHDADGQWQANERGCFGKSRSSRDTVVVWTQVFVVCSDAVDSQKVGSCCIGKGIYSTGTHVVNIVILCTRRLLLGTDQAKE